MVHDRLLDWILSSDEAYLEIDPAVVEELEAKLDEVLEVAVEDEEKLNRLLDGGDRGDRGPEGS